MVTEMALNARLAVPQAPAARYRDRLIERLIMDDVRRGLYVWIAHNLLHCLRFFVLGRVKRDASAHKTRRPGHIIAVANIKTFLMSQSARISVIRRMTHIAFINALPTIIVPFRTRSAADTHPIVFKDPAIKPIYRSNQVPDHITSSGATVSPLSAASHCLIRA